jgi:hypothetical protein
LRALLEQVSTSFFGKEALRPGKQKAFLLIWALGGFNKTVSISKSFGYFFQRSNYFLPSQAASSMRA